MSSGCTCSCQTIVRERPLNALDMLTLGRTTSLTACCVRSDRDDSLLKHLVDDGSLELVARVNLVRID